MPGFRNTRRKHRNVKRTRGRRGGYRTNRTAINEAEYLMQIIIRIQNAPTRAVRLDGFDTLARFLLHNQHIIHNNELRQTAIQKLNGMLALTDLPEHTRTTAQAALERLESY